MAHTAATTWVSTHRPWLRAANSNSLRPTDTFLKWYVRKVPDLEQLPDPRRVCYWRASRLFLDGSLGTKDTGFSRFVW